MDEIDVMDKVDEMDEMDLLCPLRPSRPLSPSMLLVEASEKVVRAAIDFGSGAAKIQAAFVDTKENRVIGESFLAKYTPLGLTEDVASHGGYISEEMAAKALKVLREFKEEALEAARREGDFVVHFAAVATDVFRKAHNGAVLLSLFEDQLGIHFQIVPQEEEGKLGFLTAKTLYQEIEEASLLAWDSGNGSFQMTIKMGQSYKIYQGPLGHGTVRVLLSQGIRNKPVLQADESGNPILCEEAVMLRQKIKNLLPPIPEWLQEKLDAEDLVVATYGDGESIFALAAQSLAYINGNYEPVRHAQFSFRDLERVIEVYIEKGDEVLRGAGLHGKTVTSALHLSALMEYFGVQKIYFQRSIGNTPGMLIDPFLWKLRN